ncbi:hypothetical protein OSTOST_03064 [Ostertagia ostertagi]
MKAAILLMLLVSSSICTECPKKTCSDCTAFWIFLKDVYGNIFDWAKLHCAQNEGECEESECKLILPQIDKLKDMEPKAICKVLKNC